MGPVSQEEFERLARNGEIRPDTLVWKEGMPNWVAYSTIQPPPVAQEGSAALPPVTPAEAEAVCAECHRIFPKSQTVEIGGNPVCASCKPAYVQKLREGVVSSTVPMIYAGFWIRVLAKVLDGLIIGLATVLLLGVLAAVFIPIGTKTQNPIFFITFGVLAFGIVMAAVTYQIWCLPKYGGTPGKRILRLRVVTAEGGPISWGRAIGRFFAEILNGMIPLYIGFIIAGFDAQKRTVHDHICSTRVVRLD